VSGLLQAIRGMNRRTMTQRATTTKMRMPANRTTRIGSHQISTVMIITIRRPLSWLACMIRGICATPGGTITIHSGAVLHIPVFMPGGAGIRTGIHTGTDIIRITVMAPTRTEEEGAGVHRGPSDQHAAMGLFVAWVDVNQAHMGGEQDRQAAEHYLPGIDPLVVRAEQLPE
jgi:hypothetical protein